MDKINAFLKRVGTNHGMLANIALQVWHQKLMLEFKQQFGEMSVNELEALYNSIKTLERDDVIKELNLDSKIIKKKTTKKKKSKKKAAKRA